MTKEETKRIVEQTIRSLSDSGELLLTHDERAWLRAQIRRDERRERLLDSLLRSTLGWLIVVAIGGLGILVWQGVREWIRRHLHI